MKIGLIPLGDIDRGLVSKIHYALSRIFPFLSFYLHEETQQIPCETYYINREQFNSSRLLYILSKKITRYDKVLYLVDVDIFPSNMKSAFGEAQFSGNGAILSTFRLRPEFYGDLPDFNLFVERCVKETIHEIAHTLGLKHCRDSQCVMYYSKDILETDLKSQTMCRNCLNILSNRKFY